MPGVRVAEHEAAARARGFISPKQPSVAGAEGPPPVAAAAPVAGHSEQRVTSRGR